MGEQAPRVRVTDTMARAHARHIEESEDREPNYDEECPVCQRAKSLGLL